MDPHRFDAIARLLVAAPSRRRFVQLLIAGAGAGLVPRRSPDIAVARVCQRFDQRCNAQHPCCAPGGQCINDRCTCRQGFTNCDGDCVDRQTNRAHCGACGHACADREQCCNGMCCGRFETCCGGRCVDLEYSDANCGGCGQECPSELHCCESRCRDLTSDPQRCGSCRTDCEIGGGTCAQGTCVCPVISHCGSANRCAQPPDTPCCFDGECTAGFCCSGTCDIVSELCAPCEGSYCEDDQQCCDDLPCIAIPDGMGAPSGYCGGCLGRGVPCDPEKPLCCVTDCTSRGKGKGETHRCLSRRGGRCRRDVDCRTCFVGKPSKCAGICRDGRCTR